MPNLESYLRRYRIFQGSSLLRRRLTTACASAATRTSLVRTLPTSGELTTSFASASRWPWFLSRLTYSGVSCPASLLPPIANPRQRNPALRPTTEGFPLPLSGRLTGKRNTIAVPGTSEMSFFEDSRSVPITRASAALAFRQAHRVSPVAAPTYACSPGCLFDTPSKDLRQGRTSSHGIRGHGRMTMVVPEEGNLESGDISSRHPIGLSCPLRPSSLLSIMCRLP